MKKLFKLFLVFMLLMTGLIPVYGASSAHFYAQRTTGSPNGAGKIYVYRGGGDNLSPNDIIIPPGDGDWKSIDDDYTFDAGKISMDNSGNDADGYKFIDNQNETNNNTKGALHMYFFAKPNEGYEFLGWYDKDHKDGSGDPLTGCVDHYPYPGKKYYAAQSTAAPGKPNKNYSQDYYGNFNGSNYFQPSNKNYISRWNNGDPTKTPKGAAEFGEGKDKFYYMRHVEILSDGDSKDITYYAKFRVKPRSFALGGTGFDDVSYTAKATGYTGSVGKTSVTANDIYDNITLTLTYDAEKYTFNGWYWAAGSFTGDKTSISTNATATYTLVAASGMTDANRIHIWPDVKRKINPVAEVTYNSTTTPYESWAEAIAAAKATGVSGATITLYKDVTGITEAQEIDRDMTLDLNGHTFAGTANYLFTVKDSGTDFTITNGAVTEGIISFSTDAVSPSYAVGVQNEAKLILEGGKIYANNTKSDGTGRGVEISNGGTLVMTGGKVESQAIKEAYAVINQGTATISGTADLYAHTTSAATAVAFYNVGTSATINGGTFRAYAATTTAYGIQQNVDNQTLTITDATVRAEAGTSTAYALARSKGTIVVNSGKYNAVAPSTVAAVNVTNNAQITLQGGIYRTNTSVSNCCKSGYGCYELTRGANWDDGYRYEVIPTSQARNFRVEADGVSNYFTSFADVNTFINGSDATVLTVFLLVPEYTVPAGNYTIPGGAALVIPYNFDCTIKTTDPGHVYAAPGTPSVYRKLILASGANITVNSSGYISVSSRSQGNQPYGGCVYGNYGQIDMKSGSTITLKSGASLYCWGYITGDGDITAESGSTIYEDFQFACWRGGSAGSSMNNNNEKVFPLQQYYIQNIETRLHLQAGVSEYVWTAVSANSAAQRPEGPLQLIGSSAGMFQIKSGSLTRWYDSVNDRQKYELTGNMTLGSVVMNINAIVLTLSINSVNYVLPINNNMDITIKSGTMSCNNDVALLPGASIKIDNGATVSLGNNCRLYVYDRAQWGVYNYTDGSQVKQGGYICEANYSPSLSAIHSTRTWAKTTSAKLDINGTLSVSKAIYTTSSGANICSSEGTGRLELHAKAGTETETYQATQSGTSITYVSIPITAAKLLNANGTYTPTAGAVSGDVFEYCSDTWKKGGCVNYYTITWKSEDGNSTLETDADVAEGSATSFNGSTPSKTATTQHTFTFDGWATEANGAKVHEINGTPAATADATYYAHFAPTTRTYTVTWKNADGTVLETDENVPYGDTPSYDGETPTKESTNTKNFTFDKWSPDVTDVTGDVTYTATYTESVRTYTITWYDAQEGLEEEGEGIGHHVILREQYEYNATPSYIYNKPEFGGYTYEVTGWTPTIVSVTEDKTYTAVYNARVAHKEVSTPEDLKENVQANVTTVHSSGRLNVTTGSLTTTDFILEATPTTSGELKGDITADNVYFDFTPDGDEGTHNRKWYAVAVPWEVDAETGIFNKDNMTAHLGLGTRFDILFYDGALRQQQHASTSACWKFLEYEPDKTMYPGRLYMVHFVDNFKTIRFKKKDGVSIHNETIDLLVKNGDDDDMNANWNGIANPATFATTVSVTGGIRKGVVYGGGLIGADGWMTEDLEDPLIVGQPIMVQVKKDASAMIATPSPSPLRRSAQEETEASYEYKVEISSNGNLCDRIYVNINDDKENHYVIGEDMAKAGVVTSRAQMWIDRYNTKLSVNTIAPINSQADFPLSVYAPEESEYVIEAVKMPEEGSCLYLTFDGRPIWNLNYSGYTAQLEKGTTNRYGLRIAKKSPMVSTGIEDLTIENGDAIRKVVVEDKVYIIRNGEIYTITGQLVK